LEQGQHGTELIAKFSHLKSMITERLMLEREEKPELIRLHLARYEFVKEFVRGKSVLDVACGSGYGSAMLKDAGASKVVGIDISDEAIAYARAQFNGKGVDFVVGNAEDLSLYRGFDVVVSFETIEHLPHPETFLAEIAHSLSPQGALIISTPQRERGSLHDKPHNLYHLREWTLEEFEQLLSKYFQLVNIYGQYGFEKKWFPYSRTLQRSVFRALFPGRLAAIEKYPVLSYPPRYKGFRLSLAYIVVVCTVKKESR
jgi:SAM-dependent methyltransferase